MDTPVRQRFIFLVRWSYDSGRTITGQHRADGFNEQEARAQLQPEAERHGRMKGSPSGEQLVALAMELVRVTSVDEPQYGMRLLDTEYRIKRGLPLGRQALNGVV